MKFLKLLQLSDAFVHNWHSGPINCYECSTLEECSAGAGALRKCLNNDAQSCVAIFNANGAVIQRGCSDNLETDCSESGDNCYQCKSHGCNSLKTTESLLECVVCDAQSDDNCVFDIELVTEKRKCNQQCITALYPTNSEVGAPLELVRSCIDDLDLDDREACVNGTLDNCVACDSAGCNTVDLGVRGSCNSCKGDCSSPQSTTCRAVPSGDKAESCFIEFDNSGTIYEMGCLSQYNVSDVTLLETNKQVWYCTGDNCNVESALAKPQTCTLCSSRTDEDCAVAPENVVTVTECESQVNSDCYSRILDNGHTERGCLTSLEDEEYLDCLRDSNSTRCLRCTGEKCNQELQPADRLSCQICDSSEDDSCETSPSAAALCLLHTGDQQCITSIDIEGNTLRGCSASLECDSSSARKCQKCEGADCNIANLKRLEDGQPGLWGQNLPLSCETCNDTTACASPTTAACASSTDYCVTVFNAEGSVTAKGCSQVVEQSWSIYCDANSANCHNCNSNECNSARSLDNYNECIYCDRENEDCESNPENVKTRRLCNGQCMTALRRRSILNFVYDTVRGCLDDKDPADQETCIAGTDAQCVACSGPNCNVDNLLQERLSCYQCSSSSDCEVPSASQCKENSVNDSCFIHFNDESDVDNMGCLSDLDEDYVEDYFHQLLLCNTTNCNDFELVQSITATDCIACDSSEDPNCVTDPSKITLIGHCGVLPYTSCMMRVINGVTQRGCVSSLPRAQLTACLAGTGLCQVCEGDHCNVDIYPADRRQCQRCNSLTDPNCSSAPDAGEPCLHYLEDEGCSAKLVDGETYRGCQREFTCDDSDKQHCRMCSGKDNCNVADLLSSNIGYPKLWATPPVNCYTCNGTDCQGASTGTLRKCVGNDEQNCATVFDESGLVVLRGCSDTLYEDAELLQYCDENAGNCKFCKSTGCNNATKLDTYVDCLFCDASDGPDCVRQVGDVSRTLSCQGSCFTGLYSRNRSQTNPVLDLARGCLDDLEYDDRVACAAGTLQNCVSCTGASCNKADVPEDRLSCNFCEDSACENLGSQLCLGHRSEDQCYILVDDEDVKAMGCASDLEENFLVDNRRDLYLCSGDDCNTKDKLQKPIACYVCDSISDDKCLPSGDSWPVLSAVCQHAIYPDCYTYFSEDGVLHRGCLMDTDDDLFDECTGSGSSNCTVCSENGCNTVVYPSDWPTCLRCDSSSDADCALNPSSYSSYCGIYSKDNVCVTSLYKGLTRRGCQSELNCDASQPGSCRVCSGADCNVADLQSSYVGEPGKWTDLPLSCYECNDLASCAAVSGEPTKCEGNNKQTCSTVFNAEGQAIARGCSDAVQAANLDYCDLNRDSCVQCKSDGCNHALSLDAYVDCYFCDAEEDSSCAWEKPTTTRKCLGQCMTGLYPRSSSWDSALLPTRGCLDDLSEAESASCAAGTHANCTACTGSLCNDNDVIESPQECYICSDWECIDVVSSKCLAYREQDECYMAYDDNTVVAMGCASDFETQVIKELVAQQRIILCSGPNCNTQNSTPDPNTCLTCSSVDDPRCATNPNQLLTTDVCSKLPYTACVTQIDARGNTIRGCLSSLGGDEFYECQTGAGELCESCTGERCNGLSVFPADRRKCYQCDSATDANCAASPSSLSSTVCPIYSKDESCVTTLVDGITHRGCNSTLSCSNPSDPRTCRVCSAADGCNTVNLERVSEDGFPGIWQPTPISCLECTGTACASGGGSLTECSGYDNCVTVIGDDGAVSQRGCSDPVFAASTYCDDNPASCPRCNSNGCNTADSLDSYVQCIVCDSSEDANCVNDPSQITKTRQCHESCVSAFLPLFGETEDPSYALVRNCYDDLEKEDRDACAAGSKRFCATCEGAKCNSEDLVASRQSCLVCQGDGCQKPEAKSCANYRENDECYIQFDDERSVSALGCLSELSHEDIYLLKRSKRLLTCSEGDCNTLESIPETKSCALCSSRTDASCAISPASVTSATNCDLTGYPECYSRVMSDGSTERGCLSSLEDDEFLSCYNGTSSSCSSCQGSACNNKLYPANRRSCHVCNSETDASCHSSPDSLTVCYLYEADDQCVTNYRNGVTYRDCSSSLSCEANAKTCVHCEGDGCNEVDLEAKADDNIGKWQDLPLSCRTCEGADACQATAIPSVKCEKNNEQSCMTVFNADRVVIQRGCQDNLEAEESIVRWCDSSADSCPLCKSNNCNNATSLDQYKTCIYCDSYKDSTCVSDPTSGSHRTRKCQGQCMTALYGSSSAGLDLIRTCLDDKEEADQLICASGNDATCSACDEDSCNTDSLPADRQSCYTCEGDDCEDPQPQQCLIYKEQDSCFLWIDEDNNLKQLGCLSSFRNQDLESILKTKRIAVCEGANCNVPTLQTPVRCAVCDSREDPTCATDAQSVGSIQTCSQMPHTGCFTKLEDDGSTNRGCLYDLDQTPFVSCLLGNDANCTVCSTDGCNREVFPADRQVCYSCTSADDSTCESDPSYTLACPWVSETETCKTFLSGNVTTRGCSSSVECDSSDFRNCRSCSGSECNAIDLANRKDDGWHGIYQTLPLKCHTCVGEHCLSSLGPAVTCSLNIEQDCKVVFDEDGVTVRRRGCSDDVDDYEYRHCNRNPELCFTCKSNECNDAWATSEFVSCTFCSSENNETCITDPKDTALSTRNCKGQCLVALNGEGLVRSCLDDKELYDRSDCTTDESGTNCASCSGAGCNTFSYPADRLTCHSCADATCTSSKSQACLAYRSDDYCFAKYATNGSVELMGCASSQNSSSLEEWQEENKLYSCQGSECNEFSRLPSEGECLSCDSSKSLECAQDPASITSTITCHAPNSECITRLENGHTIRGCKSVLSTTDSAACTANGSCAVCSGAKCNAEIFPSNRRRCHICNSTANPECAKQPNHQAVCPIYAADDVCVTAYNNGLLRRGCASELECEVDNEDHCQKCSTDGCNTVELTGSAGALSGLGLGLTLLLAWCISYTQRL
ncbi:hypothetical protein KR032_007880 [Drosophila birchii]|nr:hypothetical protein KR032_007880 [Drosophila birchii]